MAIHIRMSDGVKDSWGSKYMKSVYNDRAKFNEAINKITRVIEGLEERERKSRLAAVSGKVQEYWDDYWHTERLLAGLDKTLEEYEKAIEELTIARDNLKLLVEAAEYYKSKNWGEKSDAAKVGDGLKAIFTLGSSGSFSSENDVYFNC